MNKVSEKQSSHIEETTTKTTGKKTLKKNQ
jgi:hypothetical protein